MPPASNYFWFEPLSFWRLYSAGDLLFTSSRLNLPAVQISQPFLPVAKLCFCASQIAASLLSRTQVLFYILTSTLKAYVRRQFPQPGDSTNTMHRATCTYERAVVAQPLRRQPHLREAAAFFTCTCPMAHISFTWSTYNILADLIVQHDALSTVSHRERAPGII